MVGPLPWIGGKNRMCRRIIAALPQHNTYVEPFAGGAQVFFHKEPSAVEVLNDLDGEIVNFYRVIHWYYNELVRHLEYSIVSRKLFEILASTDSCTPPPFFIVMFACYWTVLALILHYFLRK